MSAFTRPVVLDASGVATFLERIPLTRSSEGKFDEKWLQRALFECPACLPVNEIDPHIGPLIPICMELETGSGPADILYVTPSGQVIIVETKLWRNPQARREVIGQILDYANQLTSWTYDVLDGAAATATKNQSGYLLNCVLRNHPDTDESSFVDGVKRSLETGDFESPRALTRLQPLRRWSHEQVKQVFPRSARTRCAHGA